MFSHSMQSVQFWSVVIIQNMDFFLKKVEKLDVILYIYIGIWNVQS